MNSGIEPGTYRWASQFLILVVDDDVHMVNMLRTSLELEGYRVDVATDGLSGQRKAYEIKPDLILADVLMPGVDGFSMIEMINTHHPGQTIPIIFMSGKATSSMVPPSQDLIKKYALLKKPLYLPELNYLVKRFLS